MVQDGIKWYDKLSNKESPLVLKYLHYNLHTGISTHLYSSLFFIILIIIIRLFWGIFYAFIL